MSSVLLDGQAPRSVVAARSPEAVAAAIADARHGRRGLVAVGGGTLVEHGNLLRTDSWDHLDLSPMDAVIDYSPADTVVTAQAGITLAALQELLGSHGQMLPFDAPLPGRATLGGLFASNATGTLQAAFGRPRDRALGLRAVLGTGEAVRFGGQTVKNVAGYDMVRLLAGSRGSLAVVTELTVRACARPEADTWQAYEGRSLPALLEAARLLRNSPERPTATIIDLSGCLYLRLTGMEAAVAWATDLCRKTAAIAGCTEVEPPFSPQELVDRRSESDAPCLARIIAPAGALDAVLAAAHAIGAVGHIDVGTGICELALPDPPALPLLEALSTHAVVVTWPRLPIALKRERDVWGPSRNDAPLQARVKEALDPDGVLSPGRNVGHL